MESIPESSAGERYDGRFVFVEIGGHDAAHARGHTLPAPITEELELSGEHDPVYINIDYDKRNLGHEPTLGSHATVSMHANVARPEFLDSTTLDGQTDRIVLFNTLSAILAPTFQDKDVLPKLLGKFSRMLKPGGYAVIGEWYSSPFAKQVLDPSFTNAVTAVGLTANVLRDEAEVRTLLEKTKFSQKKIDEVLEKFMRSIDPFVLVLTKA